MELNKQQKLAVDSNDKQILVVAVPGAGKTRTLTERIKRLAFDNPPENFLAITFTNAAAGEMLNRMNGYKLGFVGTCHSFAFRLLQKFGGVLGYRAGSITIIDEEQTLEIVKAVLADLKIDGDPAILLKKSKNPALLDKKQGVAYKEFLFRLRANNCVDYDRILSEAVMLLNHEDVRQWTGKYTHLFVDEFQDTNPDEALIHQFMPIKNKFYVGDSDQNIYEWRGSSVGNILALDADKETKRFDLPVNYRSNPAICSMATKLITNNLNRIPVTIEPARPVAETYNRIYAFHNEAEELTEVCTWVRLWKSGSVAVLCRTNDLKRSFMKQLGISQKQESFLPRDVMPYLRVLNDPMNNLHSERFIKMRGLKISTSASDERPISEQAGLVPRGSREITEVPKIMATCGGFPAAVCDQIAKLLSEYLKLELIGTVGGFIAFLFDYQKSNKETDGKQAITVCTVHGAKGLEFDHVAIPGVEREMWERFNFGDELEAERRLFYVAITRAKNSLLISHCHKRDTKWKKDQHRTPSTFIREIK